MFALYKQRGGFMGVGVNKKVFLCLSWAKNWAKAEPELTGLKMALPPFFLLLLVAGQTATPPGDYQPPLRDRPKRLTGARCCGSAVRLPPYRPGNPNPARPISQDNSFYQRGRADSVQSSRQ
jgi:hypothetical protein